MPRAMFAPFGREAIVEIHQFERDPYSTSIANRYAQLQNPSTYCSRKISLASHLGSDCACARPQRQAVQRPIFDELNASSFELPFAPTQINRYPLFIQDGRRFFELRLPSCWDSWQYSCTTSPASRGRQRFWSGRYIW